MYARTPSNTPRPYCRVWVSTCTFASRQGTSWPSNQMPPSRSAIDMMNLLNTFVTSRPPCSTAQVHNNIRLFHLHTPVAQYLHTQHNKRRGGDPGGLVLQGELVHAGAITAVGIAQQLRVRRRDQSA